MLSGLKFVPRDQIANVEDEKLDDSRTERRKSGHGMKKDRRKTSYSSTDEDGLQKIKSGSRKKKKWYDSDDDLSSHSDYSQSDSDHDTKKHKRQNRRHDARLEKEHKSRSKKKAESRRKEYSSEEYSDGSESEKSTDERKHHKHVKRRLKDGDKGRRNDDVEDKDTIADAGSTPQAQNNTVRKEMGLEWMLRPKGNIQNTSSEDFHIKQEEVPAEQMKDTSRELNPYFEDNGSGYPEESGGINAKGKQMLSNAIVGDGGASWRLKALKRAKEQATREGRKLQEVVEERWGSMGQLAASVASRNVAPTHAHLHAIKHRRKGLINEERKIVDEETDRTEKNSDQKSVKDFTPRNPKMRLPKVHDSLSWGKRGKKPLSAEDTALVSAAMSDLNRFSDDGSFMDKFTHKKGDPGSSSYKKLEGRSEPKSVEAEEGKEDVGSMKPAMSANQLAAKAMQLRMKGKHEEAENLLKEVEKIKMTEKEVEKVKVTQSVDDESSRPSIDGTTSRFILHDVSARQKRKEEDADLHLAQKIMHNHRYSISGQADEEYDYDDGPRRTSRKKEGNGENKSSQINNSAKRILTQQERCQFCFDNPKRSKHLIIAIANFTYLSLPQRQPVALGHCGILTLQHEPSTRTVDENVWDEIRNFKKCLIMMFAKQEKEVVFIETVMGLAQQRRHCMVECVPLPREIAKQAPVYFKKAIDEAEDEWSQHNAKKLIDTSEKGLRGSIPKNFPYFHVEFGLKKGFIHVIDDEKEFKSNFGLNVIRGILRLPAEDMHRRQREESMESQKQAVATFAQAWEPFDWTKQLLG